MNEKYAYLQTHASVVRGNVAVEQEDKEEKEEEAPMPRPLTHTSGLTDAVGYVSFATEQRHCRDTRGSRRLLCHPLWPGRRSRRLRCGRTTVVRWP